MKYAYIGMRTLTDAERGLRLLRARGIPAQIGRMPLSAGGSCAHGLRLARENAERAERLLLASGIRAGKTVAAEESAGRRDHCHDLS